ncbi:hypothetical protein IRJ41_007976 [Triplophysa rosa]|uniref:Uncharacterized protein n=1 Tax=Triplophysa rosa TaxID=992332 RepID=A0A9W7TDZ6_TRIRA|nr:hypothetical protein IRJ41_007976 [Triplophysa rosa]
MLAFISFIHHAPTVGVLVFMLSCLIFQFCCGSQNEKCGFYVIMTPFQHISCFEMMKNADQVCGSHQSNINQSICSTHNKNAMLCIKWPSTIQLTCVMTDSEQILNGKKCACDQKSISCQGEYESAEPPNSVSTLSLSIPLIAALVPAAIFASHQMAL